MLVFPHQPVLGLLGVVPFEEVAIQAHYIQDFFVDEFFAAGLPLPVVAAGVFSVVEYTVVGAFVVLCGPIF